MDRTLEQLGNELLLYCEEKGINEVNTNQVQRILKLGLSRTNQLTEYLANKNDVKYVGDGKYSIK